MTATIEKFNNAQLAHIMQQRAQVKSGDWQNGADELSIIFCHLKGDTISPAECMTAHNRVWIRDEVEKAEEYLREKYKDEMYGDTLATFLAHIQIPREAFVFRDVSDHIIREVETIFKANPKAVEWISFLIMNLDLGDKQSLLWEKADSGFLTVLHARMYTKGIERYYEAAI